MKTLFFVATALVFVGITASVFADTDRILDDFSSILEKEPKKVFVVEKDNNLVSLLKRNFQDELVIINASCSNGGLPTIFAPSFKL